MAKQSEGLEEFRSYLRVLARMQLSSKLRSKMDESDIVQQTMLQAVKARSGFRGNTEAEMAGWLRKILARVISHTVRDFGREKRDVAREKSVELSMDQSSVRLERWLSTEQSSPSQRIRKNESILGMTNALDQLPDGQRDAIELHYLNGMPLKDVADRLGRTPSAVAGLLHRGLKELKKNLNRIESDVSD